MCSWMHFYGPAPSPSILPSADYDSYGERNGKGFQIILQMNLDCVWNRYLGYEILQNNLGVNTVLGADYVRMNKTR